MANAATSNTCAADNCSNVGATYELDGIWERLNEFSYYFDYQPWIFSVIGSTMVGLSGVLPLLVIPIEEGANLKNGAGAGTLKILLSFAVGGLLGDVFLHLLPEAWASKALNIAEADGSRSMTCGLWVLTGFLVFIIAEKMFIGEGEGDTDDEEHEDSILSENVTEKTHEYLNNNIHKELENNNCLTLNGIDKARSNGTKNGYATIPTVAKISRRNGFVQKTSCTHNGESLAENVNEWSYIPHRSNQVNKVKVNKAETSFDNRKAVSANETTKNTTNEDKTCYETSSIVKPKGKHITGYLNLLANCIDNFTHGLAVGGSFLVSFRLGALTTFAILIHEIPHEVGDFAILLKSGFSRWDAARAQLLTASGGIFGALVAVVCSGSGIESRTSWILPFTAGGFLHIGMVTVLPELLKETNPKESMKQLGALLSGITVMAILTILCE